MNHLEMAKTGMEFLSTLVGDDKGSEEVFLKWAQPQSLESIAHALIAIAERQQPAELRPVEFQDKSGVTAHGGFRREYTDADNEPCAVIEKHDGTVDTVYVWQVRFLDRDPPAEPQEPPEFPYCSECGDYHDPALKDDPDVCVPF